MGPPTNTSQRNFAILVASCLDYTNSLYRDILNGITSTQPSSSLGRKSVLWRKRSEGAVAVLACHQIARRFNIRPISTIRKEIRPQVFLDYKQLLVPAV